MKISMKKVVLFCCFAQSIMKVKIKAPINVEVVSSVLTEGVSQEGMKCSFLSVVYAKHTIVIVIL
jgi:hypothetical protein